MESKLKGILNDLIALFTMMKVDECVIFFN